MKYFSIFTFILAASFSFAQDTLYTVSGQKISAKVTEITQTEIKYKKASNPDGPIYVVDKTDVALIEYKNGSKELYGTGSGNTNEQQVATNDDYNQKPRTRLNIVIGSWGWPVYNNWGWWGGYRVYPRVRHHSYYKPYRHHHYYHGRRGR